MIELIVYRNNRKNEADVQEMISYVWESRPDNVVDRNSRGVVTASADSISDCFLMVQEAKGGCLNVKAHHCELRYGENVGQELAVGACEKILDYLGKDYQTVAVTRKDGDYFKTDFVINAYSYKSNRKFKDNNNGYITLGQIIKSACGERVSFKMGDSVLFKNENNNKENYISPADIN